MGFPHFIDLDWCLVKRSRIGASRSLLLAQKDHYKSTDHVMFVPYHFRGKCLLTQVFAEVECKI